MRNKWYVYESGFADPIAEFDSYPEAEEYVNKATVADRQEGWYSSSYKIYEGSDAVSAWLETDF